MRNRSFHFCITELEYSDEVDVRVRCGCFILFKLNKSQSAQFYSQRTRDELNQWVDSIPCLKPMLFVIKAIIFLYYLDSKQDGLQIRDVGI